MPEFLELNQPEDALRIFLDYIHPIKDAEWIDTIDSLGRVSHQDIEAPHPLPSFLRSTVDGYALRSVDTYGASEASPGYMNLIGEIRMGTRPDFSLNPGDCVLIHTGGMLPEGADAVIMVEYTQPIRDDEIEIIRPVALWENIIQPGEDVRQDDIVIYEGTKIRPQEIGGMMALGITKIVVNRQPRIAVISSGDEVVSPYTGILPGQVRDINTYILQALISQAGAIPVSYGILPDNLQKIALTAKTALQECDMVIFTAGSSASTRDLTADVINSIGKPGVLVHGINIRPGKPTILAACKLEDNMQAKPIIGLPGNPVSAFVIARMFAVPVLQKLMNLRANHPQPTISARLTINLPSQAGREEWIPVRLIQTIDGLVAEPVFGKSNLIFTLSRADGLILIEADATGVIAGSIVQVNLI